MKTNTARKFISGGINYIEFDLIFRNIDVESLSNLLHPTKIAWSEVKKPGLSVLVEKYEST